MKLSTDVSNTYSEYENVGGYKIYIQIALRVWFNWQKAKDPGPDSHSHQADEFTHYMPYIFKVPCKALAIWFPLLLG